MKKLLNGLIFLGSLTMLFTSCKKEEITSAPADQDVAAVATGTGNSNLVLAAAPEYRLTRCGNDTLTYYNDGRLLKVQHNAGSYIQYSYGLNAVISKRFTMPGNQLQEEIVYFMNAQTGRVYESNSTVYSYNNNGAIVIKKTHKYEYNAKGNLQKKYNKDKPYERTFFSWNEDGNLVTIAFYNENNDQYNMVKFSRQASADKLKLQHKRSLLDPYLKIFGKGSKNLPSNEVVYSGGNPTSIEHFSFSLNTDGYPTKVVVNDDNFQIINSIDFKYYVTR